MVKPDSTPSEAGLESAGSETSLALYERTMEAGRAQLMKAKVILDCMGFTLAYRREATDGEIQLESSDFALIAEVARDFILESLEKLDAAILVQAKNMEGAC